MTSAIRPWNSADAKRAVGGPPPQLHRYPQETLSKRPGMFCAFSGRFHAGQCEGVYETRPLLLVPDLPAVPIVLCDLHFIRIRSRNLKIEEFEKLREDNKYLLNQLERLSGTRCEAVCPEHGHRCRDKKHSSKCSHRSWGRLGLCSWSESIAA